MRLFQVQQLLEWIDSRDDAEAQIVCGDFNAPPNAPVALRMTEEFKATQSAPTAFTPLADENGNVTHRYWERFDRSIDYIWVRGPIEVAASGILGAFLVPASSAPSFKPSRLGGRRPKSQNSWPGRSGRSVPAFYGLSCTKRTYYNQDIKYSY